MPALAPVATATPIHVLELTTVAHVTATPLQPRSRGRGAIPHRPWPSGGAAGSVGSRSVCSPRVHRHSHTTSVHGLWACRLGGRSPFRVCTQSRVVCTPTQAPPLAAHCNCYNTPVEVIHWTSHHCTPNIVMTAARAQYGIPQPPIPSTTQCSCYRSRCRDCTAHSQGNRSCCSQTHECGRLRWQHQRGGPRPYHSSYPTQPPWLRCYHYQPLHHSYQNHHNHWSNRWSHLTAAHSEHACSEMALEPAEPSTHS